MNLELFEQMEAPELRSYLEFFLRYYRGRTSSGSFT